MVMKIALYLDNCHFKVSRSEVKRSKLRRTYVLMIAVIPPVCGGSVIRDFLRYLVSKNTKTPSNLSRSNTHEIIPAIKKSDKDDCSYSLLLLSTFHRLILIPENSLNNSKDLKVVNLFISDREPLSLQGSPVISKWM